MKHKKLSLVLGLGTLGVLLTAGLASSALAAGPNAASGKGNNNTLNHLGRGQGMGMTMTATQRAENMAKREERRQTNSSHRVAVEAALKANDYKAFVQAVGESHPILKKVNANNFPRLVELYNLKQQEQKIRTDLGLDTANHKNGLGLGLKLGLEL